MKKKVVSLVVALALFYNVVCPATQSTAGQISDWNQNRFYKLYGEDYVDLFRKHPDKLTNETFSFFVQKCFDSYHTITAERGDDFISAFMYIWDQGVVRLWLKNKLAELGVIPSLQDELRMEAATYLVNYAANNNSGLLQDIVDETEERFEAFNSVGELLGSVADENLVNDISVASKYFSSQQIKDVVNVIDESSALLDMTTKATGWFSVLTKAVTILTVQIDLIEALQDAIDPESVLYEDLEALKHYYKTDAYINQTTDMFIDVLASKGPGGTPLWLVANLVIKGVTEGLYQKPLTDKFVKTMHYYSYALSLKTTLLEMETEFLRREQVVTKESIEEYELVFEIYLAAVRAMLVGLEDMVEKNPAQSAMIANQIIQFDELASYDNYIKLCINNIQQEEKEVYIRERMDQLLVKLNGKYFTTTGSACLNYWQSGHGCKKCNVQDVVQAKWFVNLFGNVDTNNFPSHDVDAGRRDHRGQSCFGAAAFMQYYVFFDGEHPVEAERIATGKFSKDFILDTVKPGDVLRIANSHSVLVYEVLEDGIGVIDCNWNLGGQLNCKIQYHKITYARSAYRNETVYVNRVKNYTPTKQQYKYYHYSNGQGKYSVCPYYAKGALGWKTAYREETEWLDQPLQRYDNLSYRHVHQGSACINAGCVDESWYDGAKYVDSDGVFWYREEIRNIPLDSYNYTPTKQQYKYYHYSNGQGRYSVCPYYAKGALGWKTAYREETEWLDQPLQRYDNLSYRHVHQGSACINAGCVDESWYDGAKYVDSDGVFWYREEIRTVSLDTR